MRIQSNRCAGKRLKRALRWGRMDAGMQAAEQGKDLIIIFRSRSGICVITYRVRKTRTRRISTVQVPTKPCHFYLRPLRDDIVLVAHES